MTHASAPARSGSSARLRRRRLSGLACLALLVFAGFFGSLAFGAREMAWAGLWDSIVESFHLVSHPEDADGISDALIISQLRFPRTVLGLLVGACLGTAGALIQGHTRNPLADPGILGVSAGAALAVVTAFTFFGVASMWGTVLAAFIGAGIATVMVFSLTSIGTGSFNPMSVVLGGAALSAVLSAITTAIVLTNEDSLDRMRFWSAGSIAGRDLSVAWGVAPFVALGLAAAFASAGQLNLLNLGDDVAASLGVNTTLARATGMTIIALLAGTATAAAGPITFLGLVIPHIIRPLTGPDYRWILPYSALAGAAMLLLADVVGRLVARPGELQVGIVLAFVSAPFVLALLARKKAVKL